jgi:M6 family metalloprotease-like protein
MTPITRLTTHLFSSIALLIVSTLPAGAAQQGVESATRGYFVPRGGYKRTVDMLALRRAFENRTRHAAPGLVTTLAGERAIPTILIEFDNRHGVFQPADYQKQLFGDVSNAALQPTISQYYRDMSLGRLEVTGRVLGWHRLPQDDTHYEGSNNGDGPPFGDLLQFGLDQADDEVDFGEFDNDGPDGLPNSGDDDGFVDTVFFIHAEVGAECSAPGERDNIWSHSWHYSWSGYGHSGPYVTDDVVLDENQLPAFNDDGTEKRILVEDYTIQPGLACPDSTGNDKIVSIGVITHEYGHALGLPDLYDRTPSGNADSVGIGNWGLMAGGSWGFNQKPETPTRLSAWSLARLGWAQLDFIDPSAPIPMSLEPVPERNLVHVVDVAGGNGKEYFLIEMKDPDWTDAFGERLNWDSDLPSSGLAIWHVDDNVGATSLNWPFAPHDQGQNDSASLPNRPKHSLVSLEQADCNLHLERRTNGGDNFDLWKSGDTFGQGTCNGGSVAYNGSATGLQIMNIDLAMLSAQLQQTGSGPPGSPTMVAAAEAEEEAEPRPRPAAPARPSAPLALPPERGITASARLTSQREFEGINVTLSGDRDITGEMEDEAEGDAGADEAEEAEEAEEEGGTYRDLAMILSDEQQDTLIGASNREIERGVDLAQQKQVKAWVAEKRHYQIQTGYDPQSKIEEDLVALREAGAEDAPINAQLDPSMTKVQRITGLHLPSRQASKGLDSDDRVQTTLKPLIGEDVRLRRKADADPSAMAQQYEQIHVVGGEELPVFSKGASVYYDSDGHLTTLTTKTADLSNINLFGTAGQLDESAAAEIAIEQLGLPAQRGEYLKDTGEGIYLVDEDPSNARIVRRLTLQISETQPDLTIYVDEETHTVVGIE